MQKIARLSALLSRTQKFVRPTFPLTGADVLAAGVAPGPKVGEILGLLEEKWIEFNFSLDRAALTARLEEKGFIQRERSAADRRVVKLELTPEGRATAGHIPSALCKVQNELLAGFTREEFDTLKSLLRRMLANAQTLATKERA